MGEHQTLFFPYSTRRKYSTVYEKYSIVGHVHNIFELLKVKPKQTICQPEMLKPVEALPH